MKKQMRVLFLLMMVLSSCNNSSEDQTSKPANNPDSSLQMTDGTVNADTIDKRTDARQDKGMDTLQ